MKPDLKEIRARYDRLVWESKPRRLPFLQAGTVSTLRLLQTLIRLRDPDRALQRVFRMDLPALQEALRAELR